MFARLLYEFELWKLQREMAENDRFFAAKQTEALAKKLSAIEMQRLDEEEIFERQTIRDKIARLQTEFLRNEAERYLLEIPSFDAPSGREEEEDAKWEFSATGAHYQLKPAALAELRSAIRKEKKERREAWQSWAALAVGILGAMIGLVSALKK